MERFVVVTFQTMAAVGDAYEERGGGIVFFPVDDATDLDRVVAAICRAHFKHTLGPVVQIGLASLDASRLRDHCRAFQSCFWQGGEHDGPRR